jgi:DNA-binding transcriptional ArsR family regulator
MLNREASLDRVFQALADTTRRAIVMQLTKGPATVSALAQPHAMTLPGIVQHLRLLEESGLVRSEKVGRVRTCSLEPSAMRTAEAWLKDRRGVWERHFDQLGEFLDETFPTPKRSRK